MRRKHPAVYILASLNRTLYVGVTSDLLWRVWEHKSGLHEGFTKRYKICRLVYFERFKRMDEAIAREKQIKRWGRAKKISLIESANDAWDDLASTWYEDAFWNENGLSTWEVGAYNPGYTHDLN